MIYPAKKPQVYVRSRLQPRQDSAVQFSRRVWNQTEPNRQPKTGPMAGYPDPLPTLGSACKGMYACLRLRRDQGGNIRNTVAHVASSDLRCRSVGKIVGEDLSPHEPSR
jgi:hypothetical protein